MSVAATSVRSSAHGTLTVGSITICASSVLRQLRSARPKIPHIRNFERSWPSDVGLNSGSGFASFGEPVVLGDQIGQHSTTIALIRANWTHRCRESYDPIPWYSRTAVR